MRELIGSLFSLLPDDWRPLAPLNRLVHLGVRAPNLNKFVNQKNLQESIRLQNEYNPQCLQPLKLAVAKSPQLYCTIGYSNYPAAIIQAGYEINYPVTFTFGNIEGHTLLTGCADSLSEELR